MSSRNEDIMNAIIYGKEMPTEPQSRNEALLIGLGSAVTNRVIVNYSKNILNPSLWEAGGIQTSTGNNATYTNSARTDYFEIDNTKKIILMYQAQCRATKAFEYDKDKNFVKAYNLSRTNQSALANAVMPDQKTKYLRLYQYDATNITADDISYAVNNVGISQDENALVFSKYMEPAVAKINRQCTDTVLFSGDSIVYGAGWATSQRTTLCNNNDPDHPYNNLAWVQTYQENHPNAKVYGYGSPGTTIQKRSGRSDSIVERIDIMKPYANKVIFHGMINDSFGKLPIGTVVTSPYASSGFGETGSNQVTFNENTFAGALESIFRKSYKKWPNAKIGFILTPSNFALENSGTYVVDGVDYRLSNYITIAKTVCNKWRIPYLDLFNDCGVCTAIEEINDRYFQLDVNTGHGDRTHPTEELYRRFLSPKVEDFVDSL